MKKMMFMAIAAFTMLTLATSCKKKLSDEEVTKAATEALVAGKMTSTVSVAKGVATITGTCTDEKCKADCETIVKGVKGVESVVNNCVVVPPTAAPTSTTTTTADPKVVAAVQAVIKDIPTVTVTYEGQKAVFAGTVNAKQKNTIAQACMAAKVAVDMTKVTIK